ncbi:YitT family protein [Petroclostridium sp. X23]|uniref:YitT family protein n=1 Tax=Petroclostridium sp. X23 TaxID=3045146 RepID=UPI0024AD7D27|nr:YitT family protein [Petroclostridium sp. X23]WHH58667.1 YitT family protein [Petroclostridium sp. X23]
MGEPFFVKIKAFLLINIGLLFVALGIFFFKIPNNFATGGVSGIAMIMSYFFSTISVGPFMLIINIVLLIAGFIFIGFNFGSKTAYSSFVLSGMVWLLEKVCPPISQPLTGDTFLELIFAIVLPAIGSAIVFNQNASTGGTDIIAKILNKYMHVNIGKTLLIADFLITLIAGAVFGIRIGMYSMLGLFMKGFIVDLAIEGMNISKEIVIISEKPEQIKHYIVKELHRGATIYSARGAFTDEEKEVITTIVNRRQAVALRSYIRSIDDKAFMSITNTSEIIGKGFRTLSA